LGQRRPRSGEDFRMVEGSSGPRMSSGRRGASRWPRVVNAPDWALGVVNLLGEALGNLDTCYHPDEDQILTITECPHFLTCQSMRKRSWRSKDTRMDCERLTIHHDVCATNLFRSLLADRVPAGGLALSSLSGGETHQRSMRT